MTLYAVFEPKFGTSERVPRVVPERFSWLAALLPPVFFLRHGLWLELVAFVVLVVVVALIGSVAGGTAGVWLYGLLVVWLGSAAPSLRRLALKRSGWRFRGEVTAPASDTAKLVWLRLGRV